MNGNHYAAVALVFIGVYLMNKPKTTKGIRNNNPLNIREAGIKWNGEVDGHNGEFEQFSTAFDGIRAAARLLKTYRDKYNVVTVESIISRWAPPSENNTESYIAHAVGFTGLEQNQPLIDGDYPKLIEVMILHENGVQPYDETLIQQAFEAGFYG